jgi:hypothetical protein
MATQVGTAREITEDGGSFTHDQIDLTRSFEVLYDAADHNPQHAQQAAGVPTAYSPHPNNLNALLLRKSAPRVPNAPFARHVRCEYTTKLPPAVAQALSAMAGAEAGGEKSPIAAADPNPLNRPTRWIHKTIKRDIAVDRDRFGKLILTSSRERINPVPTRRKSRSCYVVTKNLPQWNGDLATECCDHVNSVPFLGYDTNCVYLDDLYAEQKWENGYRFFEVQATFIIDLDQWIYAYLDAGFMQLVGGAQVPIRHQGQLVRQPWPLRNGIALTPEEITSPSALIGPRYLETFLLPETDFTALGLF